MDSGYNYFKIRKNFGRLPMFSMTPVQLLDTIEPTTSLQKQYILRNPVHTQSQASVNQSEHLASTNRVEYHDQGTNHGEGGWPKDINFYDKEATYRHIRRSERDNSYVNAVLDLQPKLQHYINQNNAIDMYEMYFKGMEGTNSTESYGVTVNNVYRDAKNRPIACINWTLENNSKIAVAYFGKIFPMNKPANNMFTCCIWDIEYANYPVGTFEPPCVCWQIACSPVTPKIIVGGMENGRVCIFDLRHGSEPVCISEPYLAHRDPVSALIYIRSRLNTEFFSGSTDGRCMWYDIRQIKAPIESLIISIRAPPGEPISLANAEGVTALHFDRAFLTKFLCGTNTGFVVNVNRKGKTLNAIMSATYSAHNGPVTAVHRSPSITKMFITCGDWSTHVWSEEVVTSPIITGTKQRYPIFDVAWAPNRVTSYMTVSGDGKFRYWDMMRKLCQPMLVLPVSKCALLKIKAHEDGRMIAVGDAKGAIHLITLSGCFVLSGDKDKSQMAQTFERETRRARILENRVKEIRLKLKTEEEIGAPAEEVIDEDCKVKAAEDEYRRIVQDELRGAVPRPTNRKIKALHSR